MLLTSAHSLKAVIPAKAGIQLSSRANIIQSWTPAFAGVTGYDLDLEFGV